MKAVGIICEYNPFHAGHAHQLMAARRDTEADVVVAVMSEHATQRGELAVADGYTRAEAAVRAGVDLVIGLPFPYSSASAEFFALAGVRILDALGVMALHFGSECGNIEVLQQTAERLYSPAFIKALTDYQQATPTHGILECRDAVYQQMWGCSLPNGSNDLLGMAYLHALSAERSAMRPYTTARIGQDYNDTNHPVAGLFPSASSLRALWQRDGLDALSDHLPTSVFDTLRKAMAGDLAPINADALGAALLSFYRLADPTTLARYADMGGGLAERLCHAARQATALPSMLTLAATRRYTDGRLRRAMLYGMCGVTSEQLDCPPAYVRLLAANVRGCAYLSHIRKSCTLPILTKPADLPTSPEAVCQRAIEERLETLVTLAMPTAHDAGALLRYRPYIEKK